MSSAWSCRFPTPGWFTCINPWVAFDWFTADGGRYPFIPVQLSRSGVELDIDFILVDTGADVSVLPLETAGALGIASRDLEPTQMAGLGGRARAMRYARRPRIEARVGIYTITLPEAHFLAHAPLILGRDALFGEFELKMSRREIALRAEPRG